MAADRRTYLHNYLCNNSGTEVMVDVTAAVDRLNSHCTGVMDSAWAYSNRNTMTTLMGIDSDWRSSDRMDYSNPPGRK
jgi:hypothetical protein